MNVNERRPRAAPRRLHDSTSTRINNSAHTRTHPCLAPKTDSGLRTKNAKRNRFLVQRTIIPRLLKFQSTSTTLRLHSLLLRTQARRGPLGTRSPGPHERAASAPLACAERGAPPGAGAGRLAFLPPRPGPALTFGVNRRWSVRILPAPDPRTARRQPLQLRL